MTNDRELFQAADADADGRLDANEFVSFTHPEEVPAISCMTVPSTLSSPC